MDKKVIEESFKNILGALEYKENIDPEVFAETPKRMADLYEEIFSGLAVDPADVLKRTFACRSEGIVIEKAVDFHSVCEHHLLPFFGKIAIGYIPDGKIVGFGDIVKVIEILSKRPQLQERLGEQIAEVIYKNLECKGICVYIEAEHLCMTMRGVRKPGSKIITVSSKGVFESPEYRAEFLTLVKEA